MKKTMNFLMTDNNQGGISPPKVRRRKYVARLESGHQVTMICMEPLTVQEAARVIRDKFGQSGKFIRSECGDSV